MQEKINKQETLEESAERIYPKSKNQVVDFANDLRKEGFLKCAKWQQEQDKNKYSEEEVLEILYKHTEDLLAGKKVTLEEWFEQFKNK
jgi:hypothetical protein